MMISPSKLKEIEKSVYFQAHKFPPTNVTDLDDYVQSGMSALVNCANKFDPDRKTKLLSYAFRAIYREINAGQYKKFKRKSQYVHEFNQDDFFYSVDAEKLWEILPDNLTEVEKMCVELLVQKHKLIYIARQLAVKQEKVIEILKSAIEKIREANEV